MAYKTRALAGKFGKIEACGWGRNCEGIFYLAVLSDAQLCCHTFGDFLNSEILIIVEMLINLFLFCFLL